MRGFVKAALWILGILAAIVLLMWLFVFDVWTVPDDDPRHNASIEPSLSAGDLVLLTKAKGEPSFGHLVRCVDPDQQARFVVGRVYGSGRDQLVFDNDVVTINGKREPSPRGCDPPVVTMKNPANGLDEELVCQVEESAGHEHPTFRSQKNPEAHREVKVEQNRIFLVSDNRHFHLDSRDYGALSPLTCQHLVFRLWGKSGYLETGRRFTVLW
jgi:signal peptidase I